MGDMPWHSDATPSCSRPLHVRFACLRSRTPASVRALARTILCFIVYVPPKVIFNLMQEKRTPIRVSLRFENLCVGYWRLSGVTIVSSVGSPHQSSVPSQSSVGVSFFLSEELLDFFLFEELLFFTTVSV